MGATVYPGGVVIVPLLMPPFAIGVGDVVAIEFRRNWTAPGCEIAHTSAQIAQPIRLRCAETDPVVAALRSLVNTNAPSTRI